MTLYHGTNENFTVVDLSKSRLGKDFGIGFYLTPNQDVAQRQAERKLTQYGMGSVYVHAFSVDENKFNTLNVLRFDISDYTMEWADFILLNRRNKTKEQVHDYDVVIGPIADDTVGYQIRRLEDGIITKEQFLENIKYHNITVQYLFATEKSIEILIRL